MMVFIDEKQYENGESFKQVELPNHYVDYIERGSDTLFVTFDGMKPKAPKGELWQREPWAAKFIRDQGHDHIGVKLKKLDWYRSPDLHQFWRNDDFIRLLSGYKRVMFYGLSMGAYAALVFSSVVEGSCVLALVPQTSLDPKKVPWDKRFERGRDQNWSGDFSDAVDCIGAQEKIYVVYDPFFGEDRFHFQRISSNACVRGLKTIHVGHNVDRFFLDHNLLKDIVCHALDHDLEEWFPKAIRVRKQDAKSQARLYASMALRAGHREKFPKAIEYTKKSLNLDITNKLALAVAKRLQDILK